MGSGRSGLGLIVGRIGHGSLCVGLAISGFGKQALLTSLGRQEINCLKSCEDG
jgi:hypothetical protein